MSSDRSHIESGDSKELSINDRNSAISDVLFLSIGEGAVVIDERGNISRVNKIALDILGCKAEDLIGKWYPETLIAEEEDGRIIPNIERPITEAFLSGRPIFKRLYYRRKDGLRVPLAVTVSPVIQDDKPLGAIELFRDITEDLQLEHAKDEFISIASHQLRTPAAVVKQYLGMIIDGFAEPHQQLEMIKVAYEHNENQINIINTLLNIAQVEANKIKPAYEETDLVKLLEKIIAYQCPEFDKRNIKLRLKSNKNSAKVYIDPLHLQMVFENLINNANKYSPPNTAVTVEVMASPRVVTVNVKDQGVGIDPKDIPKLFSKFSRLDNARSTTSGTGLGLYWAKKLIDLYKGEICIKSKLNKGTIFSVKLPLGIPK